MCIGYAFRPYLSSRLTWSGRTFLQKPKTFGHYDSHIILATHSGILTSVQSTRARRSCFTPHTTLLYHCTNVQSKASVYSLAPLNFRRRITRPVSYYALFECVAASEPTSWLSTQFHILFHLTIFWDLSCWSGLFPF